MLKTIEELKGKYGSEGIRNIAVLMQERREQSDDLNQGELDLMIDILLEVGNILTQDAQ